jgi:sugar lactone lactonase YvrE
MAVAPRMKVLTEGHGVAESPRWHDGRLWFSDWRSREILTVGMDGGVESVVDAQSFPFCFDWLPDGRQLVMSGAEGLVLVRDVRDGAANDGGGGGGDADLEVYADLSSLGDTAWKEIVVDGRGNAYVANIGFDFAGGAFEPGFIALVTPDGKAREVADGVRFPHGMALTPDGGTLIVAEAYGNRLSAFAIGDDGELGKRRLWADLDGVPHGICVDREGAVWYADVPGECCVRVAEGGDVLDIVEVDRGCFSCALGGPDGSVLFLLTADWEEAMDEGDPDEPGSGRILTMRAPAGAAAAPVK